MNDVAEAIAGLRARFLARCADDVVALRRWRAAGAPADDDLRRLVHRLAGAAGTFGFPALSTAAKAADERLTDGAGLSAADLAALVAELERVIEDGRRADGRGPRP